MKKMYLYYEDIKNSNDIKLKCITISLGMISLKINQLIADGIKKIILTDSEIIKNEKR